MSQLIFDEPITVYETEAFQTYTALVEDVLRLGESTFPDGRPKGMTESEINRALGDDVRPLWTTLVLGWLSLMEEGVPVRYRHVEIVEKRYPYGSSIKKQPPTYSK